MMRASALVAGFCATGFWAAAVPALAQSAAQVQGDVTAFEVCFLNLMIDNTDNPIAGLAGPVICGERHVPMRQSCSFVEYIPLESRTDCKARDLAFWREQVAVREAVAQAEGRSGVGDLHRSGLIRCDSLEAEGRDATDCRIEINWRTTMEFLASDLMVGLEEGR